MAKANSSTEDTLGARKRKLEDIMRNEPKRVTRYPILLSSTRQNIDVASNFFEVWVDDKYQEDLVYCQGCKKIASRQKRHNSNLVLHLKRHNQCNEALSSSGDAPQETGSTSERDGEPTCSTSKANTGGGEGASAASTSPCETEIEAGSISHTPMLEVEPNTLGAVDTSHSFRFIIRGHSPSTYHIEAAPSDANLAATPSSEPEADSTSERDAESSTSTSEAARGDGEGATSASASEKEAACPSNNGDQDSNSSPETKSTTSEPEADSNSPLPQRKPTHSSPLSHKRLRPSLPIPHLRPSRSLPSSSKRPLPPPGARKSLRSAPASMRLMET